MLNLIAIAALMCTPAKSCALKTHHDQAANGTNLRLFGLIVMRFQGSLLIKLRICGRTAGSI